MTNLSFYNPIKGWFQTSKNIENKIIVLFTDLTCAEKLKKTLNFGKVSPDHG